MIFGKVKNKIAVKKEAGFFLIIRLYNLLLTVGTITTTVARSMSMLTMSLGTGTLILVPSLSIV